MLFRTTVFVESVRYWTIRCYLAVIVLFDFNVLYYTYCMVQYGTVWYGYATVVLLLCFLLNYIVLYCTVL